MSFFLSFAFITLEVFAVIAFTWTQPPPWAVSLVVGLLGTSVSELIYGLGITSRIPVPPEKTFIK
jgi:ABC-type hemin transport system substrate-binding protein